MKNAAYIGVIAVSAAVIIVAVGFGIYLFMNTSSGQDTQESPPQSEIREERLDAPPSGKKSASQRLSAGESGVVEHASGARIEVPRGALTESVTVSISEVEPPPSPAKVGRAFDFTVGGELAAPVTIHIPFELEPGQDALSVHALHWDEQAVGWEPVPGRVDESAGTIAVKTDSLSIFSWMYIGVVEASCVTEPTMVSVGETFEVVSAVRNLNVTPVDIYMAPSVDRVGDIVGVGPLGRSEVAHIGSRESLDLKYEMALPDPGEYRVECGFSWDMAGITRALESPEPQFAIVTVRSDEGPTVGAYLRIERIEDLDPTIYPGYSYAVTVDVGNGGDRRSGRFDLVIDFTSTTDGQAILLYDLATDPASPLIGRHGEVNPSTSATESISVEVPDDLPSGRYRVCVRIEPVDGPEGDPAGGACLDRFVLYRSGDAMVVKTSPIDTRDGQRAWAALPADVSTAEVVREAIEFAELQDDRTLRTVYKRLAGELAFRKAVAPGPERQQVLVQGLKPGVEIAGYITDVCLQSGFDCTGALERSGLLESELLTKFPDVPNEAVSFVGQSLSASLLFYDAYYTMLVNQALDLHQAMDTLDGLEKLPLSGGDENIWKLAVADARNDVEATASSDNWTAFAAAIYQNRGDFLQFAGVQTVSGLVHAAAKRQMLQHAGIAGQKAMISALGLKPAGGTMLGSGGVAAAGPTAFVASVWFAAEVYRSVEEQEEQMGTATLAAFVNAAFSDPNFIDEAFSDPEERANLREAVAYAKYLAYHTLYEAEDGWLNWLSAWVKSYTQDRDAFLKEMEAGREQALEELMWLFTAESVEVDPGNLTLAAGETHRLSVYATTRSGRSIGNRGFEWTSDARGTATVSHEGVVTGVSPGEAVVTARAGDTAAFIRIKVSAAEEDEGLGEDESSGPDVVPTVGRITFASVRMGNTDIYVMDADGTNETRLTDNRALDINPAWSPDGRRIAFTRSADIYVMNADGTNEMRLTENKARYADPAWSPDGHHIAFTSDRDGNWNIYVMDADGTNETRLTDNEASDDQPTWSPDGHHIAFASVRDGNRDIYVMDADGTNVTRLTDSTARDIDPAWSPDGRRIAFASVRNENWDIYVMDADDTNVTRLTDSMARDIDPAWSPDGRRIAFSSGREGDLRIYVMDADGTNVTRLTNGPGDDARPSWEPAAAGIPPAQLTASSTKSYEDLLKTIPDTPYTRKQVHINDYTRYREFYDIALSSESFGGEESKKMQRSEAIPSWWTDVFFGPFYHHTLDLKYLGFGYENMDQSIIILTDHFHDGDQLEVIKGRFNTQRTDEALKACSECPTPELVEHRGIQFYSWGEDYEIGPTRRLAPPAFDEFGFGSRIAVVDSFVLRTLATPRMQSLIDAKLGQVPSLADSKEFQLLAAGMSRLGAFSMFLSDEVQPWKLAEYEHFESLGITGPWLRPYKAFALGGGADDGGAYTALVLLHADEGSAVENVGLLRRIIREERSVIGDFSWSDHFDLDSLDIYAEGPVLLGRLRGTETRYSFWEDYVRYRDSLILYE